MTRYQTAITELKEILAAQPPEPYAGRPRRPNNYRNSLEYREWSERRLEWMERIIGWEAAGLEVAEANGQVEVTLYGRTVAGTVFVRRPDGCVKFAPATPYIYGEPFPEWAPGIAVPRAREDPGKFLDRQDRYDRTWELHHKLDRMLRRERIDIHREFERNNRNNLHYDKYARNRNGHCLDALHEWLAALRRILDYKALARLAKLTGQPAEYNLRNHNLAIVGADAIRAAARTNPGAAAWWMRLADHQGRAAEPHRRGLLLPEHLRPFMVNEPEEWRSSPNLVPVTPVFPRHPGMIIAGAKSDYERHGGARWKALAGQPAEHIAQQLERHGIRGTIWLSEVLGDAALPIQETERPPEPAPPPPRRTAVQELLPLPPPAPKPEPAAVRPAKDAAPPPGRAQPPLEIKLMLLELRGLSDGNGRVLSDNRKRPLLNFGNVRLNPDQEAAAPAAVRRTALLACRHYAGAPDSGPTSLERRRRNMEFEDLADYLFDRPAAAARAATWKGLLKASARWHHAHNLQAMRDKLLAEAKERSQMLTGWQTPINEIELVPGVTARVLTSAHELAEESLQLSHCVSNSRYAHHCMEGHTRIIHIQPAPGAGDPEAPDRRGTTLEIFLSDNEWRIGQHRGLHNRAPTPAEAGWARAFLTHWRQAMNERADRILRTLPENGDPDEDEDEL